MWPHPRLRVLSHDSELLKGNAAGDPHVRDLALYLPPGYDDEPDRRYPVLFVLVGFTGIGLQLVNVSRLTPSLPERMDRLVASGEAEPTILVMPDTYTRFGGSQYLNSTATGRYADYLTEELVPFVDREFRTLAAREHRGVVGKSSGGFGALRLGMSRPDLFGAVGSHAGDCYFELCYKADVGHLVAGLRPYDGDPAALVAAFHELEPKPHAAFSAMNLIGMAAAYSPDPAAPLGLALPWDTYTGELDPEVWARWLEHDPVERLGRHVEALRSLRLLYIDAGLKDEYHLQLGARILSRRLTAQGVPHTHEEFDGGHMGTSYRYDRSLPLLTRALAPPRR